MESAGIYGAALVLALLAAWAAWSRRAHPSGGRLQVLESASLGQGRMVAVVQAGRKRLLVGVTAQSIGALAELDPADWQPAPERAAARLRPSESEAS